jgi:ketosteroid isomerase-like protein
MVDGTPYQNRYLSLATVRDGKIAEWTEYSDPAPIEQAMAALNRVVVG